MKKCPVCKVKYWKHTLKLHITNTGSREVYKTMDTMLRYAKNKPYTFSPLIFLRNCPHYQFKKRNMKNKLIFEL